MVKGDDQMTETTIKEFTRKYIQKTECVLKELRIFRNPSHFDEKSISVVIEEGKRYLEDAKYYFDKERFETSLASIAYCEGVLDALKILKLVDFSW